MEAVFTAEKRVTFVEKTLSEVGDGTAYPMLATLDQIAEIWFRAKDARFTAGESSFVYLGETTTILAPLDAPTERVVITTWDGSDARVHRGYAANSSVGTPADTYLGAAYDSGNGTDYFQNISSNERSILSSQILSMYGTSLTTYPDPLNWNNLSQINAFSFYSYLGDVLTPPSPDYFAFTGRSFGGGPFTDYDGAAMRVGFNGEIAVVKVNPSDSIFALTNTFYLGVLLEILHFPSIGPGQWGSTNTTDVGTPNANVCNYIIKLASSQLSCPFYVINDIYDSVSGSDFIHEATEWWPYAKNSPAVPVWDAATGFKI